MNHSIDQDLELKDIVAVDGEKFFISTIKMEVRHSWLNQHENVFVYETMIFEKASGKVQYEKPVFNRRYTSYEEALDGHKHSVANIKNIIKHTRECRAKIY
ncbi:MAG: hypothetical protein IBX44_05555 [Sulfurospirillum sp.]|nr:hypothetical protein [Sulfurospirillum sp.]